jgi:negative regulator of replication initiation
MEDRPQMNSQAEDAGDAASDVLARRRLLKVGAYAAYTAPILLAMATSAKAQTTSQPIKQV